MKNKRSLLLLFILFFKLSVFSQSLKDEAYLLVKYDETSLTDSTDLLKKNYDVMGLEIGKNMSRFYSISLLETKNAIMEQIKKTGMIDMRNITIPKNRRGKMNIMFKNYSPNQLTSTENLGMFSYTVKEIIPVIDWKIQSDTMRILNYICQKATCQFRGRNYEAWFTTEINISEGPWKFSGLPGLILKVSESKGFFIFECKSIEKVQLELELSEGKGQKIAREDFLKLNKLFMEDPLPFMSKSSFTIDSVPTNLPKRTYNPMELTEK